LEPDCRDPDMSRGLSARIFDPLWMLTRQWQVGEFQGEDTGSPATARVRAQTALLSRCHLGAIAPNTPTQAPAYDSERMPLEVMVEQQRVRPGAPGEMRQLRLVVDAGLHFLRMLETQTLSRSYRRAFISIYPLSSALPPEPDDATASFIRTMAGRALDARLLEGAFRAVGGSQPPLDARLQATTEDGEKIRQTGAHWLAWYDGLFSEPDAQPTAAWNSERMEYAVSVAGRLSADPFSERTLTATELYRGDLDWLDFDLNSEVNLGTQNDEKFKSLVQTTIPAPVNVRGTPAVRFWEFEDARVEYGLMPAGPADLAQLLMIEYTSSYGNDWFVVPVELQVGSLTTVDSLVVTDTFGVRMLLRPLGDRDLPAANWSMFQHSHLRVAGTAPGGIATNLFFLAPALPRTVESEPVEDVLLMRDEMANVAWAIERSTEGPLGVAVDRTAAITPRSAPGEGNDGRPRCVLASQVPTNWVPLLPVQSPLPDGGISSRLRRGALLQPDGPDRVQVATGVLLNPDGRTLSLFDEEVPREGARITRHYQLGRWVDGSTYAWVANRKTVGRGEGSSGLRFDTLATEED
jgi:hypothetical protein